MPGSGSAIQQDLKSERPLVERAGWIGLILVVLGAAFAYGHFLAFSGVENTFDELGGHRGNRLLARVELLAFAVAAVAAARLQPRADQIRMLRETALGALLPLLMASSLVGLCAYLIWSGQHPQSGVGPDSFGYTRWLGTALAIAFPLFWVLLFPRVTAILAGMIAGPALFALFGYAFFESLLGNGEECHRAPLVFSLLAPQVGFVLLSKTNPLWLVPSSAVSVGLIFTSDDHVTASLLTLYALMLVALATVAVLNNLRTEAGPLTCAVVTGLLAVGLAVVGADFGLSCVTL